MNTKTTVTINIPLDKPIHTAAKMAALKSGKTLKAWIAEIIGKASK